MRYLARSVQRTRTAKAATAASTVSPRVQGPPGEVHQLRGAGAGLDSSTLGDGGRRFSGFWPGDGRDAGRRAVLEAQAGPLGELVEQGREGHGGHHEDEGEQGKAQ